MPEDTFKDHSAMPTLPDYIISVLAAFAPLFTGQTFARVQVLLLGAILTAGRALSLPLCGRWNQPKKSIFRTTTVFLTATVGLTAKPPKCLRKAIVSQCWHTGSVTRQQLGPRFAWPIGMGRVSSRSRSFRRRRCGITAGCYRFLLAGC